MTRPWKHKIKYGRKVTADQRTQIPLLPQKQCSLHGVQRKTADPGCIAHLSWPRTRSEDQIWLAPYVALSRLRSLAQLYLHGFPNRKIMDGGPPKAMAAALETFFSGKIARTKINCKDARKILR